MNPNTPVLVYFFYLWERSIKSMKGFCPPTLSHLTNSKKLRWLSEHLATSHNYNLLWWSKAAFKRGSQGRKNPMRDVSSTLGGNCLSKLPLCYLLRTYCGHLFETCDSIHSIRGNASRVVKGTGTSTRSRSRVLPSLVQRNIL